MYPTSVSSKLCEFIGSLTSLPDKRERSFSKGPFGKGISGDDWMSMSMQDNGQLRYTHPKFLNVLLSFISDVQ